MSASSRLQIPIDSACLVPQPESNSENRCSSSRYGCLRDTPKQKNCATSKAMGVFVILAARHSVGVRHVTVSRVPFDVHRRLFESTDAPTESPDTVLQLRAVAQVL